MVSKMAAPVSLQSIRENFKKRKAEAKKIKIIDNDGDGIPITTYANDRPVTPDAKLKGYQRTRDPRRARSIPPRPVWMLTVPWSRSMVAVPPPISGENTETRQTSELSQRKQRRAGDAATKMGRMEMVLPEGQQKGHRALDKRLGGADKSVPV